MLDPGWLSFAAAAVSVILYIPTFLREINEMRKPQSARPAAHNTRRLALVIAILVIFGWGAALFSVYGKGKQFSFDTKLIQIAGRTYKHETVQLDGYEFISCTFNEVTFKFDGIAPTGMRDVMITGSSDFTSSDPAIKVAGLIFATLARAAGHPVNIIVQP
jgi:hypothetical protein